MAEFGEGITACSHERTEKEYYLGMQTGDIVCLDCGATWWQAKKKTEAAE